MTFGKPVGVGVLGASGYTGCELVRLLQSHPGAKILALGSRQYKGIPYAQVFPGLPSVQQNFDDDVTDPQVWIDKGISVVFAALPHAAFAERAKSFVDSGLQIIDLSADFRLHDPQQYPLRYHFEHPHPDLLKTAVYGLCEWEKEAIGQAQFVANPGCYTTASLLAVLPAIAAGLWNGDPIVINAISGISGAGRGLKLGTHFVEATNSIMPYKVGETHVHLGELRQVIGKAANVTHPCVIFNPHLAPMNRGISASIALPLNQAISQAEVQVLFEQRYVEAPFVRVLCGDELPETRHVRGSNRCDIAVRVAANGKMLLVFSAIDNLIKGASGQAIQNWNIMQKWPETTGLSVEGWTYA